MQRWFWFEHIKDSSNQARHQRISRSFVIALFLCLQLFALAQNIKNIIDTAPKRDFFEQNITEIAYMFWNIDPELSKTLSDINTIWQEYLSWNNIFTTRKKEILRVKNYLEINIPRLVNGPLKSYSPLLLLAQKSLTYNEEIQNLLWRAQPQLYLVILQNTSEKRPNGGFFGSFAIIELYQWFIKQMSIIDSYYPNFLAPTTFLQAPSRTKPFLSDPLVGFISANKLGFTNLDGNNIAALYEMIFWRKVAGVVFVKSELFEKLIPWFDKKFIERQFINASVDLIRGANLPNKKAQYIKEINDYFQEHKVWLVKTILNNMDLLKQTHGIQIYLKQASTGLQSFLEWEGLLTRPDDNTIFIRDSNISFNKIDRFVTKHVEVTDSKGNLALETTDDRFSTYDLKPWTYTTTIYYTLSVPSSYADYLNSLEKKYKITLTEREQTILWLLPKRETRGTIYSPQSLQIENFEGDVYQSTGFSPPFGKWIAFQMLITQNNQTKKFSFTFTKR